MRTDKGQPYARNIETMSVSTLGLGALAAMANIY